MQLFYNFDTKLDERELQAALKKYGAKNQAILTKRHPMYLFISFIGILCSFFVFFCMLAFSYFQYFKTNPKAFGTICAFQLIITLFWIVHSLVVILISMKNHAGKVYINEVPEDGFKPGTFENYLKHSFISLIAQGLLMIANIVLAIVLRTNTFVQRMAVIWGTLLNIMFLTLIYLTIQKIISYEMDFNIFTPELFTMYRQRGLLKSESTSVSTSTIKMIKEEKSGRNGSLFWYGTLNIHPEWGVSQIAPMRITYVTRPKILLKKLNELVDASKLLYSNK